MSYDLMVFEPKDAPRERDAFLDWFRLQTQWAEGHTYDDPANTSVNLAAWYAEMRREFPNMNGPDAYEVDDEDDNARVTGYSIGKSVIYADFRWSEAEAAYAAVRALAVRHDVGFFNVSAQDGEIWFPPVERTPDKAPLSGLTLSLEGQQAYDAPSRALIEAAIDWLEPAGGPGFLVLEEGETDYVQVGGGKDACTVEWREYSNGNFTHWVAGLPDGDTQTDIEISGNGTRFPVKANERLSKVDVKVILNAFAGEKLRLQEFLWRDITAQFDNKSSATQSKPWWQFWR